MAAENLNYVLARMRSVTQDDHPFVPFYEENGTPTPTELIDAFSTALSAMADFVELARGYEAVETSGATGMLHAVIDALCNADLFDQVLSAQDAQIAAAADDVVAGLESLLASETDDA